MTASVVNLVRTLEMRAADVEALYEQRAVRRETLLTLCNATGYFDALIPREGQRLAVVFDVDETALSGYRAMKGLLFREIPKLCPGWVKRRCAPANAEVLAFYRYILARGLRVVFVSGRKHFEHADTEANLKAAGFDSFDKVVVRAEEEQADTALAFKTRARRRLVEEGYTIAGCIGDQQSDLCGEHTGLQMKLPNYLYIAE
jgi:predicted secreted acid phosphatase